MAQIIECRLKELLSNKGMNQKWLAEQVGLSPSAMSQIVRGESKPNMLTTLKISEAMDLIVNEIWVIRSKA